MNDLCDDELDPGAAQRVRRHLAGCDRCRRALDRLRATIADVGLLGERPVPDAGSMRDRIAQRIAELDDDNLAR